MNSRVPLSKSVRLLEEQPAIPPALQAAAIAAIRWAWPLARQELGIDPMYAGEEEITSAMETLLNQKRMGRRRAKWLRLFKDVQRSGQHRASTGSFRQTPDLKFQPRAEPREVTDLSAWGLFAECKIIGPLRNHSLKEYCNNGLGRFADGRYAPCMSSGLMIAYVRDGKKPHQALRKLLRTSGIRRAGLGDRNIAISSHRRDQLVPPCVAIEITHLWLDA